MRQNLIYGKISWSYDEEINFHDLCLPVSLLGLSPIKIRGRKIELKFSDKVCLKLLKLTTSKRFPLVELYSRWARAYYEDSQFFGEGRAFLEWMRRNDFSVRWRKIDVIFHPYFNQKSDWFDPRDDYLGEHAFSIPPVVVHGRKIKLYLKDEDVIHLLHLPHGEDCDFLELVQGYIQFRLERENKINPLPSFVDWINFSGKRPLIQRGQLHWDKERYFALP